MTFFMCIYYFNIYYILSKIFIIYSLIIYYVSDQMSKIIPINAPYSLLEFLVQRANEFEKRSGAKIIIKNNNISICGEEAQCQNAANLISELLREKSDEVPPRYDLCLRIDNFDKNLCVVDDLLKSYPTV